MFAEMPGQRLTLCLWQTIIVHPRAFETWFARVSNGHMSAIVIQLRLMASSLADRAIRLRHPPKTIVTQKLMQIDPLCITLCHMCALCWFICRQIIAISALAQKLIAIQAYKHAPKASSTMCNCYEPSRWCENTTSLGINATWHKKFVQSCEFMGIDPESMWNWKKKS